MGSFFWWTLNLNPRDIADTQWDQFGPTSGDQTPLPSRQIALGDTPIGVRIKRACRHFRRIFSCVWRPDGSDLQAERGRGEANLSPKRHLTHRPRVGGLDASAFCTDVGVFLGLAEVHSDRKRCASGSKFEVTESLGDLWVSLFHVRNLLRCMVRVFHRDG